MKNIFFILSIAFLSSSCYKTISVDGFDKDRWLQSRNECDPYREEISDLLIENQEILLESTQNEIESLLGQASEHELYQRNQKFFHYRLTPLDSCGSYETVKYLSVRFNAIGRANLVQVMLREP